MFDYDACHWFVPVVAGEPIGHRFAHVAAVFSSGLYIIGGRNMANSPLRAVRIDLAHSPYEAREIWQVDEPDAFQYGGFTVVEGLELALFGAVGTVWNISLTAGKGAFMVHRRNSGNVLIRTIRLARTVLVSALSEVLVS
jgi:hypothetical protein